MDKIDNIVINDIHLVRLTRNAWSGSSPDERRTTIPKHYTRLLALDYFDQMAYISYDDLMREMPLRRPNFFYFGQYDPFDGDNSPHPPLSHLLLTLVELEGMNGQSSRDPFSSINEEQETGDQKPFFSLISIIRIPNPRTKVSQDPLLYLKSMYNEIYEAVLGEPDIIGNTAVKILYSMNSGTFVVAVRDKAIETAYTIALRIRSCGKNRYDTFTTTAVECVFDNEGYPKSIDIGNFEKTKIALRFQVDGPATIKELQKLIETSCMGNCPVQNAIADVAEGGYTCGSTDECEMHVNGSIGLYGRYDVTFTISLRQFSELFPALCQFKFTLTAPSLRSGGDHDRLVEKIIELMQERRVFIINARPLLAFDIEGTVRQGGGYTDENRRDFHRMTLAQNAYLNKQIKKLQDERYKMLFHAEAYKENINLLRDIVQTYSGVRCESDSLINGYMFTAQMTLVTNSLSNYLNLIGKEKNPAYQEILCQDIVNWMRSAIVCINNFAKLVQSINLQSIQSPNFEMQTRVDMEKYAVAYSEFLRKFSADYFRYFDKQDADKKRKWRKRVLPVFTTDPTQSKLSAYPLFPQQVDKELENDCPTFVAILIPSGNYFTLLYDTLPLVIHEISHNYRFVDRHIRNRALSEFTINYVVSILTQRWLTEAQHCLKSVKLPIQDEIVSIITKILHDGYMKQARLIEPDYDYSIDKLGQSIMDYLNETLFIGVAAEVDLVLRFCDALKYLSAQLYVSDQSAQSSETADFLKSVIEITRKGHVTKEELSAKQAVMTRMLDSIGVQIEASICNRLFGELDELYESLKKDVFPAQEEWLKDRLLEIMSCLSDTLISPENAKSSFSVNKIPEEQHKRLEEIYLKAQSELNSIKDELHKVHEGRFSKYVIDRFSNSVEGHLAWFTDCRLMYAEARRILNEIGAAYPQEEAPDHSGGHERISRKSIACDIHAKLYAMTEQNQFNQFVFNSEMVTEAIGQTGILSHENVFMESFLKHFVGDNSTLAMEAVHQRIKLYKEVFSDLCMCAAIGFSPFGYLRFYMKHYASAIAEPVNINEHHMIFTRCALVVSALVHREVVTAAEIDVPIADDILEKLGEDQQYKQYIELIEEIVRKDLDQVDEYIEHACDEMFTKIIRQNSSEPMSAKQKAALLALTEYRNDIKDPLLAVDAPLKTWEKFCNLNVLPEKNIVDGVLDRNNLFEYLKTFSNLSIAKKYTINAVSVDTSIHRHVAGIYINNIVAKELDVGCIWEKNELSANSKEIRLHISSYFNSTNFQSFDIEKSKWIFHDNLKFAIYHYNSNRCIYENNLRLPDEEDDELTKDKAVQWLNAVIEGERYDQGTNRKDV